MVLIVPYILLSYITKKKGSGGGHILISWGGKDQVGNSESEEALHARIHQCPCEQTRASERAVGKHSVLRKILW